MKNLIKGILGGICIAIGGIIFLLSDNKVLGAFFFAIGLLTICINSFNLYTGKIGYVVTNFKKKYYIELGLTLLGNLIGTFITALVMTFTRISAKLELNAVSVVNTKLDDTLISILILSIFCGLLMYIAVNGFKTLTDFGKYLIVFMAVMVFILCGFEHCIANMFYISMANAWTLNSALYMLIMIIGNSIGGCIIPLCDKIKK